MTLKRYLRWFKGLKNAVYTCWKQRLADKVIGVLLPFLPVGALQLNPFYELRQTPPDARSRVVFSM